MESFGNVSVNKSGYYVLAILLGLLKDHSVINQRNKLDTMC